MSMNILYCDRQIADFRFLDEKHIKSFMKRLNKIGPNIDPLGTPLRISR